MLIGHNIIEYDLLIIVNKILLKKYIKSKDLIYFLIEINNYIINTDYKKFNLVFGKEKKNLNEFISNIFVVDTIKCINNYDKSLFYFKTKLFFSNTDQFIIPLEFNFNKKFKNDINITIKNVVYNNSFFFICCIF